MLLTICYYVKNRNLLTNSEIVYNHWNCVLFIIYSNVLAILCRDRDYISYSLAYMKLAFYCRMCRIKVLSMECCVDSLV